MNQATQMTHQEMIYQLQQQGYQECTQMANRQQGTQYPYAFMRLGDEQPTFYCCAGLDDLVALWSLVRASASQ